jgi:adenylate cyclase
MIRRLCVKPLIEKVRYMVKDGKQKWEIDEFLGANEGLVLAELETEDAPEKIPKPDWVGEEVTSDPRYFNLNLVKHPFSEWMPQRS